MQEERVAVWRGFRDLVGADRTAAAADVFHHDRLAECLANLLREDAREQSVVPPAGNGTTHVMVRLGNLSCARTIAGANSATPAPRTR